MRTSTGVLIGPDGVQRLIDLLLTDGWTVIGPHVVDGVVAHTRITSVEDLPRGIGDEQRPAHYRLANRVDDALFAYAVGPQSWKPSLFPSRELIRRTAPAAATTSPHGDDQEPAAPPRLALFGVRSCDLAAIAVQDRVLLGRESVDTRYAERRDAVLIVALTCSDPGGTCFCDSMGTGPDPKEGFDLALTELLGDAGHRFLVRAGTDRGSELLARLEPTPATDEDRSDAAAVVTEATSRMGRQLDTTDLRDLLYANADHPTWDDVAQRCLACSNCTLVCPTCFCTTVTDTSDLVDGSRERWRVWDSCFTGEFTHLEGGDVRSSTKSRYRQWATHKLAAWWDQFGSSGCVGCGRCITWCPAAIDITAEVAQIRSTSMAAADHSEG